MLGALVKIRLLSVLQTGFGSFPVGRNHSGTLNVNYCANLWGAQWCELSLGNDILCPVVKLCQKAPDSVRGRMELVMVSKCGFSGGWTLQSLGSEILAADFHSDFSTNHGNSLNSEGAELLGSQHCFAIL